MAITRDGYIPIEDTGWPVTFYFEIIGPGIYFIHELTVDLVLLEGEVELIKLFSPVLFVTAIAPAMSATCSCGKIEAMVWKLGRRTHWEGEIPLPGLYFQGAGSPERTPVAILQTGHMDSAGRRRYYFVGSPHSWTDDQFVTPEGAGHLRGAIAGLLAGMHREEPDMYAQWLIPYPNLDPFAPVGTPAVQFRAVQSVRLCQYHTPLPVQPIGA